MNNPAEISTRRLVKRMMGLVKHLKLQIGIAVGFAVLGFLATILIPSIIVDLGFKSLAGKTPQITMLLGLFCLGVLRGLFRYGEHYFGHYVAFKTLANFRKLVFQKLQQLAPAKLDNQDSGSMLKMISEDIEALEVFFAHTIPPILTASSITLILTLYFWNVAPSLAIIGLITYAILAVGLPKVFAAYLQPLLKKQAIARKKYISYFSDSLQGMKELVQFKQTQRYFNLLTTKSKQVNAQEKDVSVAQYLQSAVTFLVIGLALIVFASLTLLGIEHETINLQKGVTAIIIFATSFAPYLELSRLPLGFKRAINAARQVFVLLDEPEFNKDGVAFNESIDELELNKIAFAYPTRKQAIFEDVSATFEKHKIIGLIGPSGSGKSTLMKLIMRWYNVTNGEIKLNKHDLKQYNAKDIQQHIAYIPQIPQIFKQTIRENLTFGNVAITDEQILVAAQKCHIKEKVLATKQGLDTIISSEQKIFSAGELQRLELTRALLKNADCYVFDEPTSNLDSLNEAAFLQVIRDQCKGYVFLISHRPSTVACSDVIYKIVDKKLIRTK